MAMNVNTTEWIKRRIMEVEEQQNLIRTQVGAKQRDPSDGDAAIAQWEAVKKGLQTLIS